MGESERDARLAAALAAYIDDLVPHWPVVGGAVALVARDRTIATLGFGLADRERREPATSDHLFQIGSISKSFVSLVVNQLVDEGPVDLERPVTAYLPWVELGDRRAEVTLRQLLSHTAGLVAGTDAVPDDLAQIWALRSLRTSAAAQGRFHYSNVGYQMLGRVVGAATGAGLAEALRARVFEPLGMPSTLGRARHTDRVRMATGYWPTRDDIPWAPGDALTPAAWFEIDAGDGNVVSSATDLARWARLWLGDGQVDGVRVASAAAMTRMMTPTAPDRGGGLRLRGGPATRSNRYGLGLNVEELDRSTCLTHGGGMVGFGSYLLADRTHGVGIVVLINANGCYPLAQIIARAGHRLLTDGPDAALPPAVDPLDASIVGGPIGDAWLGEFGCSVRGLPPVKILRDDAGSLEVSAAGTSGPLIRTWTPEWVCTHPVFREFRWQPSGDEDQPAWGYGPFVLRRRGSVAAEQSTDPEPEGIARALIGRYRCSSPWFPTFRIIWRAGRLFLVAPGGVAAPDEDCELVADPEGAGWRIGAEPWAPERLTPGPVVDGHCISVYRDDLLYSRIDP